MWRWPALLERLGHRVAPAWPPALGRFWGATAGAFAVASDATRPPVVAWVGERLGRPVRPGELDDAVFEAAARAATRTPAHLDAARRAIAAAPVVAWWDEHDLLVTPATFQPAWPLGGSPGPRELGTLAAPVSLSGQPALAVPVHRTDGGLPVGVQVVGRRGADELLLDLACDLQEAQDWTGPRPPAVR